MIAFAEAEALKFGSPRSASIRMLPCTKLVNPHKTSTQNIHTKLRYQEFARVQEDGFDRVFMRKRLSRIQRAEVRSPARSDLSDGLVERCAGPTLTLADPFRNEHKGEPLQGPR